MKILFSLRQKLLLPLVLLILTTCSDKEPAPAEQRNLVDYSVVSKRTASQLQLLAQLSGAQIDPSTLKYDVTIYKANYATKYKGEDITASGLIILPYSTSEKFPVLSIQHGTIVEYADAPSVQNPEDYEILLYSALASAGFVTVVPDYIGFGASKQFLHPYYVAEPMAASVVDNVRAATNLCGDKKIGLNSRLFLAGYSEGGYATLAAHKKIDEEGLKGMNLVASFPAAGGYDLMEMQQFFFSSSTYTQPFYLAYVLRAYETFYGFSSAVQDVFSEPYATRVPDLFNGVTSSGQINSQLTYSISDLTRADIRSNILTDTKYSYLVTAFKENSLTDWIPKSPIYFYHGDADEIVPYHNSEVTVQKLIAKGASQSLISLTTLHGKTHGTGATPYFESVIDKLLQMK